MGRAARMKSERRHRAPELRRRERAQPDVLIATPPEGLVYVATDSEGLAYCIAGPHNRPEVVVAVSGDEAARIDADLVRAGLPAVHRWERRTWRELGEAGKALCVLHRDGTCTSMELAGWALVPDGPEAAA